MRLVATTQQAVNAQLAGSDYAPCQDGVPEPAGPNRTPAGTTEPLNGTPFEGNGQLKVHPHEEHGVIGHFWKDEQESWSVYARVVANAERTPVVFVFPQPAMLDDAEFDMATQ